MSDVATALGMPPHVVLDTLISNDTRFGALLQHQRMSAAASIFADVVGATLSVAGVGRGLGFDDTARFTLLVRMYLGVHILQDES